MNKALRKAVIAGNWKMNKTPAETKEIKLDTTMVTKKIVTTQRIILLRSFFAEFESDTKTLCSLQ